MLNTEAKRISKSLDAQKSDTTLLIQVPLDVAQTIFSLEPKNYFRVAIEEGGKHD